MASENHLYKIVHGMSLCRRWGVPITNAASGARVCWRPLTNRSPAPLEHAAEPLGVSVLHRQLLVNRDATP